MTPSCRSVFILATLALLTACGTATPRIAETTSGLPEVIVANTDTDSVRAKITDQAVSTGYSIDSETQTQLTISKEVDGMRAAFMQMAISNAYSTTPREEVAFTILKTPAGVKVIARTSASSIMPMGQVRRVELKDNNTFNFYQEFLNRVKVSLNKK